LCSPEYALKSRIVPNLRKSQSRKKRHVVAWIREAIGLTQSEFAHLIGASRDTIQSIELVRLTLSERFAYKIAEETGISPRWLLANKLGNPPPDPERIRQQYEDAQAGRWKGISKSHLLPRAIFFRLYAFYRAMISEVGYSGFRSAGGIKLLEKFCHDLIMLIPDKRRRKIVYRDAREIATDSRKLYDLVFEDSRELQRNFRESQREKRP